MIRFAAAIGAMLWALAPASAQNNVRIITPPPRAAAEVVPAAPAVALHQTIVVAVVVKPRYETRAEARRRALFQTWTGFYKVYSGERYPF